MHSPPSIGAFFWRVYFYLHFLHEKMPINITAVATAGYHISELCTGVRSKKGDSRAVPAMQNNAIHCTWPPASSLGMRNYDGTRFRAFLHGIGCDTRSIRLHDFNDLGVVVPTAAFTVGSMVSSSAIGFRPVAFNVPNCRGPVPAHIPALPARSRWERCIVGRASDSSTASILAWTLDYTDDCDTGEDSPAAMGPLDLSN
jgi:hypothetical protein